jgi:hypothetical protein
VSSSAALFGSPEKRRLSLPARATAGFDTRSEHAAWRRGAPLFALMFAGALVLTLATTTRAYADASVIVELKRPDGAPADGVVRLTKGDTKLECTTQKGRCQLSGVAGGTYNVEVVQSDKPPARSKRVMIPPAGEVKLIVAAQ